MALSSSIQADELMHDLRRSESTAMQPTPRDSAVSWQPSLAAPRVSTMLTQSTRLRPTATALSADKSYPLRMTGDRPTPIRVGQGLLGLPFDALRVQYASAVMAGLVQRSLLASGRWERALDALEKLMLGPLARER